MTAAGDAALVASLFAVDPAALGGVCIRSQVHPARDQWLQLLRHLLPAHAPLRRIPFNIADSRLLGGLDLAATLQANRPVAECGVLAASNDGVAVVSMAERLAARTAAYLSSALDTGEVVVLREGISLRHQARVGIVALDEGIADDEYIPRSLLDRLAFPLDLNSVGMRVRLTPQHGPEEIALARELSLQVRISPNMIEVLCATALALGVESLRVSQLACRAARAAAALECRIEVIEEDAIAAGRLVLAPRAFTVPPQQETQQELEKAAADQPDSASNATEQSTGAESPVVQPESASDERSAGELESRVLAATQAAIPPHLLARISAASSASRMPSHGGGRAGELRHSGMRGRPCGVNSGPPRANTRLNVIETLRAAAPWQRLRGRGAAGGDRVRVEAADFRVTRCKQRARTLTIFAVDASGSAALNRLAEAKGAVELLLAECYIRRDQVALISFRGQTAELLLPPTRSLVRAKRGLAGLPGGGGTPLAAAIDSAVALAERARRRGETPTLVLLTDGRANIARNGAAGREAARGDALRASQAVRLAKIKALFIDTSVRPSPLANELASAMNAHYVPLPFANSRALSDIVKVAATVRT